MASLPNDLMVKTIALTAASRVLSDSAVGQDLVLDYAEAFYQWAMAERKAAHSAPSPFPLPMEVRTAYSAVGKVAAIKELRHHTGLGLRESKDAIEDAIARGELTR